MDAADIIATLMMVMVMMMMVMVMMMTMMMVMVMTMMMMMLLMVMMMMMMADRILFVFQLGLHLLSHLSGVLLKLSKSVQSQQRLCQAGLIGELLDRCSVAVYMETHPLYPSLQHMFERLASQVLAPYELRYTEGECHCIINVFLCTLFLS